MAILTSGNSNGALLTFESDLDFLKKYVDVVVLSDSSGQSQVAVVPAYQGRVMTSTAKGLQGLSFGWVNRELISSRKIQQHINVYGGEDRFWLGPEGGQYSIFFSKGSTFDLDHWFTPPAIDTEPFDVVKKTSQNVVLKRNISVTNYSGAVFNLEVEREVRLVRPEFLLRKFGVEPPKGVFATGFESINTVKNIGKKAWSPETGLLSIWILGMFNASPSTTVVIPISRKQGVKLTDIINDRYFGKVPNDRIVVKNDIVFFKADANYRSKIGIKPQFAKSVFGSYDADNKVLTIVHFSLPEGAECYVNSMWEFQKDPYNGDVVNSYNDGPAKPGAVQLGKFYELESSSPALALQPAQSATHIHQTTHFQGEELQLDIIAKAVLGVGINEIKSAFK